MCQKSNKCFNLLLTRTIVRIILDLVKKGEMNMLNNVRKGLKTGIIIFLIYVLFVLYLLLVSDRVEKLESRSSNDPVQFSLKIG